MIWMRTSLDEMVESLPMEEGSEQKAETRQLFPLPACAFQQKD